MDTSGRRLTTTQVEIYKELTIICSENGFWLFMAMQGTVFKSENSPVIQYQINNFAEEWGTLFSRYYDQEYVNRTKVIVSNFFDLYLSYLNHEISGGNQNSADLLAQWKNAGNELAKNFANVNPYWREQEWRAIINNQISILERVHIKR